MATQLDLEEQEQLDQLKHFWKQYGNLITWLLVAALAAYAGWNGWNYWKREQAAAAGSLYDSVEQAVKAADVDKVGQRWNDMKERYPGTIFAAQAGLLAAKTQFEKGKADDGRATLQWVAEHAGEKEYRAIARLRLAGALMDAAKYDDALRQLSEEMPGAFAPLAADRRGDVLQAQGKKAEAIAAYQQAWKAMDAEVDYRRMVEAKLTALGAPPAAASAPEAAQ
jgi:predicted negative regulator of RcsB-dependent stress response